MQFEPLSLSFDTVSSTLFVGGSVDEMSADKLRDALNRCMGETAPILTVDLSKVSFLTSVGIGVLAAAMHRGADLGSTVEVVARAGSIPDKVLAICGLPHTTRPDDESERWAVARNQQETHRDPRPASIPNCDPQQA